MHDGRWCGVDDELSLLYDTGCYADFTFPSAPDESQPEHREPDLLARRAICRSARCYENGVPAQVGERHNDRLLMIEGPLALARRPGRCSPTRIENGALTADDPPHAEPRPLLGEPGHPRRRAARTGYS